MGSRANRLDSPQPTPVTEAASAQRLKTDALRGLLYVTSTPGRFDV
jgi:hypothetical protein